MAFRRGFRRPFRKTFRRRGPPMARVRRTWFTSFRETFCSPVELDLDGCDAEVPSEAENDLRIILIDNASLQTVFSDRARVARIVGDIFFYEDLRVPPNDYAFNMSVLNSVQTWQMFVGLRKDEVSDGQPFGNAYDPMMNDFDFSEAEWIKTWQRAQIGELQQSVHITNATALKFPVVCTDTHTSGILDNSFTNGTGTINIETDCLDPVCVNCDSGFVETDVTKVSFPKVHHFHIDHRRKIRLRENEQLMLQMGFVFPLLSSATSQYEPNMRFFGGVKTLIEV